jgi:hypothetical protein
MLMSLPLPHAGIDAAESKQIGPHEQDFYDIPFGQFDNMLLIDQLRKSWSSIALGIILAGGFYPILGAFLVVVIEAVGDWTSFYELFAIILAASLFALVGTVAGMVWTNVCVVATLPLLLIVVWSLRIRGSIIWIGASWGGLIGFLAVLPFLFWGGFQDRPVVALLFGPALTTVLGQAGGAWGGRRAVRRIAWYESIAQRYRDDRGADPTKPPAPDAEDRDARGGAVRLQFRIRHLLWIAVWVSIFLSTVRLLGIPFEIVMPFLGGWLAYQAATLWIGGWLVRLVAR